MEVQKENLQARSANSQDKQCLLCISTLILHTIQYRFNYSFINSLLIETPLMVTNESCLMAQIEYKQSVKTNMVLMRFRGLWTLEEVKKVLLRVKL